MKRLVAVLLYTSIVFLLIGCNKQETEFEISGVGWVLNGPDQKMEVTSDGEKTVYELPNDSVFEYSSPIYLKVKEGKSISAEINCTECPQLTLHAIALRIRNEELNLNSDITAYPWSGNGKAYWEYTYLP